MFAAPIFYILEYQHVTKILGGYVFVAPHFPMFSTNYKQNYINNNNNKAITKG